MPKTQPASSTPPTGRSSTSENRPPAVQQSGSQPQTPHSAERNVPEALADRPPLPSSGVRQRGGFPSSGLSRNPPPGGRVSELAAKFDKIAAPEASNTQGTQEKGKQVVRQPPSLRDLPPLPPSSTQGSTSAISLQTSLRPLPMLDGSEVDLQSAIVPSSSMMGPISTASSTFTPIGDPPSLRPSMREAGTQTDKYRTTNSLMMMVAAAGIEVVAKGIASALHFGLVRNTLLRATGEWEAVAAQIAAAMLVAEGTGAAHEVGEMLVKPILTKITGLTIDARDPRKVFDDEAGPSPSGESVESRRFRMSQQQSLGKVNSLPGNLAGLIGFGTSLGVAAHYGATSVNSLAIASGVGGAVMQLGHTITNLTTGVVGEPTHEVRISQEHLTERLREAVVEVLPRKIPATEGAAERDETVDEVLRRLSYDVTVGRGVPLLQGAAVQMAVQAGLAMGGYEANFATGMLGPVALLGVGFFPLHPPLRASYEGTGTLFEQTLKNLNAKPTQLMSLVSPTEQQQEVINALKVADGLHLIYSQVVRIPSHLLLDGANAVRKGLDELIEKSRAPSTPTSAIEES